MKKTLLLTLQVVVTVTVLFVVFRDPNQRAQMGEALRRADRGWLLFALAVTAISPLVATVRWGLLLHAQGIPLAWRKVTEIYFIGNFFNLFGLGSTGGDVVKVLYTLRAVGKDKRTAAFMTVVMDRLIGLMSLIGIAAFFVITRYRWLTQTPVAKGLLVTVGLILGSAVFGVIVTAVITGFRLDDKLPARLPGRAKIIELGGVFRAYGKSWRTVLIGLVISVPGHMAIFTAAWASVRALKLPVSFLDVSAIMPIINTMVSVPSSVAGVGVREWITERLFKDLCNVGKGDAVVIAETTFLCVMCYYLAGGVVYLFHRSEQPGGGLKDHDDGEERRTAAIAEDVDVGADAVRTGTAGLGV